MPVFNNGFSEFVYYAGNRAAGDHAKTKKAAIAAFLLFSKLAH